MKIPFLTLVTVALVAFTAHGQERQKCGTPEPDADAWLEGLSACGYLSNSPQPENDPSFFYDIPVVFHVIQRTNGKGYLSPETIQDQIDVLNEDFRAIPGTPGAPGTDGRIRFHLARVDPNGNPTTGITYSTDNDWYRDNGDYWTPLHWDTNRYMNIYTNAPPCCYGYVSGFPANGIAGRADDRIVLWWEAVGKDPTAGWPLNMGRTGTHEAGHYLGVYHTFCGGCGDPNNCDTTGDVICDTNGQQSPTSGCPGSSNSCGNSDPFHNYMDYTDDPCVWEFTPEQVNRMRCTLEDWRPDVFTIVDLSLDANKKTVMTGDPLTLSTYGGLQGGLNFLAAVDLNGNPTFLQVDIGSFDVDGIWSFGGTVPAGLSGLVATFQSIGFYESGGLGMSNREVVTFN